MNLQRRADMADRTVCLTEEGTDKVGYNNIHTTDEQIVVKGHYIFVTSSATGKTYILDEDDIAYID